MFFMPIPKLIHSFLHQFNSGTVKLVKIFFNYCIFFEYFAVNFLQKIRSGRWEKFPKIKKREGIGKSISKEKVYDYVLYAYT